MILFGTLGGIIMFGVVGVIIGPIIAALFVTVWEIYGVAFKDVLPLVGASGLERKPVQKTEDEDE
jgi:predicted PurR-regulated permease PerM